MEKSESEDEDNKGGVKETESGEEASEAEHAEEADVRDVRYRLEHPV